MNKTTEPVGLAEFAEIVYNPNLNSVLVNYFLSDTQDASIVEKEIKAMIDSGTVKPIIFTYLLTTFQVLRVTNEKFVISDSATLNKIRSCVRMIYDDEDYSEKITKQLFKFLLQTSSRFQQNPQLRGEISSMLGNLKLS